MKLEHQDNMQVQRWRFGCIIGYMPSMFAYALYGSLLDNFEGIQGYNYVFSIMVTFSLLGFICATILAKRIKMINNTFKYSLKIDTA